MSQTPTNSEQLSAWLDGELDDGEAAAVERELEIDARLRAELDELREVRELLRTHGPRKAPKSFHAAVMARVDQEPLAANHSPWRFLRRPFGVPIEALAVAAAALFVVMAGLNLGTSALQAPFEDFDLGSRGSRSPEKGDRKEEVASPVAPSQQQTVDPTVDEDQGKSSYDREEPKPQAKKAKPPPPAEEADKLQIIRGGTKETTTVDADGTLAEGTAEAPDVTTGTTAPAKAATPEQVAPSGWRYQFVTNADILASLQTIAARTGSQLVDDKLRPVSKGTIEPGDPTVYWLKVKAEKLPQVLELLGRSGGSPSAQGSEQFNAGQYVTVRIDIMLDTPSKQYAPSSKPASTEKK